MTKTEIEERVAQTISSSLQLPVEKITPEARLVQDLDIDSLFVVQITMELEEAFGIHIEDEDINEFKTVDDINSYVEQKLAVE